MPEPDINVLIGADNSELIRQLRESYNISHKTASEIAGVFRKLEKERAKILEREEKRAKEAMKQEAEIHRQMQARTQHTRRLVYGALAVSVGVFSKALRKAAERDDELARSLGRVAEAKDDFLADIGDDLAPLIDGLDTAINLAGDLRDIWVDYVAITTMRGDLDEIRRVREQVEIQKELNRAFKETIRIQNLDQDLRILRGGPGAREASDLRTMRAFNRRLVEEDISDPFEQDRLRAEMRSILDEAAVKDFLDKSYQGDLARRGAELHRLELESTKNPYDIEAFNAASLARQEVLQRLSGLEIPEEPTADDLKAHKIRFETIAETERFKRESFAEEVQERQRLADLASKAIALDRQAVDIQIQRARGKDDESRLAMRDLDMARKTLDILRMTNIDELERIQMISDQVRLRNELVAADEKAIRERDSKRSTMLEHELEQNSIELERIKGRKKLADLAQAELDFARERFDIMQREGLDEEARSRLIEQRRAILEAKKSKLGGLSKDSESVGLGPGLMGGSTLIRQLVGANGLGMTQDPVEMHTKSIAESNAEILEVLKNNTGGTVVAVAG